MRERLRLGERALARFPEVPTRLDVATRDDIKSIRAGMAASPFGGCLIGECTRGICHLTFFDDRDRNQAIAEMNNDWPLAKISWNDAHAASLCRKIFSRARDSFPTWKLLVSGTPFQVRVWNTLLRVPSGALVSYAMLAAATGHPQASRATGAAVGANPVSFLIPCHRVIRASGETGHYHWGAERKRAILEWEATRITSD